MIVLMNWLFCPPVASKTPRENGATINVEEVAGSSLESNVIVPVIGV